MISFAGARGSRQDDRLDSSKLMTSSATGSSSARGNDASDDEPLAMRNLNREQKDQLAELLDEYMTALESGLPPSVQSVTQSCPDLREAFQACVAGLESLQRLAAGNSFPFGLQSSDDVDANLLGDFQLHEEIGRGGMGVVYRATQKSLHRVVAIKLLPLASTLDSRKLKRFRQEAEAAASLLHPNIVPVFAVGCERGIHFYAMQFIDGSSMGQRRIGCQPVSEQQQTGSRSHDGWRTAVDQAAQIADGLHAAHEFGVIHRDVKPSNLIVDREGKPWITDFGLARIQSDASLTQSGDVIGTMRYMSPEQARGESAMVDGRTDVYSLGATLYEMLAGRPAHDGEDAPSILRQIDDENVTPLKKIRDGLPRDLGTVVAKAMANRRDDRYETAFAFADDLRRVLADEPTIARPPTLMDHGVRFALKYRNGVAATAIVCMLALAGFAVSNSKLAAQKRVSDENASLALQNESITREAIDRLGSQMAELLADIPAANSVRHRLLTETLEYYQRIATQSDASPLLKRERELDLAMTHGKIGSFQGELGLSEEAITSLQKSEQLFESLARRHPNDLSLQLQWSISQNNLAQQFANRDDLDSAMAWFGKAIANQKRLPSNETVPHELATTLNNFGQMLTESENATEAESVFVNAIALLNDQDQPKLLATIESNLAGLIAGQDPERAAEIARRSLSRQTQAMDADPSDAKAASRMVVTLNTLALSLAAQSEYSAAAETLQQAIGISEQLRIRWPDQPVYRRDLGISWNQLGLALSVLGKTNQASDTFQHAAEQARVLTQTFADDAEVHSMLGSILNNSGFLNRKIGNIDKAVEHFTEAIRHQERAVSLAPQVTRYGVLLRKQQNNQDRLGRKS